MRSYEDEALSAAIAGAFSWRAVLRALGLPSTSGSMIRSVRLQADRLGYDYSHFRGHRRWTDAELTDAVARSTSSAEVARRLGLAGGSGANNLKGHAARLGLNVAHLDSPVEPVLHWDFPAPNPIHLRRAGSVLAASWFNLRGCDVAWPLEPCPYDLIAMFDGKPQRVQVKTTTHRVNGTWYLNLKSSRKIRVTYDPDEIDFFFAINRELACYLIPVATVGGLHAIHLSAYAAYRLDDLAVTA